MRKKERKVFGFYCIDHKQMRLMCKLTGKHALHSFSKHIQGKSEKYNCSLFLKIPIAP